MCQTTCYVILKQLLQMHLQQLRSVYMRHGLLIALQLSLRVLCRNDNWQLCAT
jgi:hypothetical protein